MLEIEPIKINLFFVKREMFVSIGWIDEQWIETSYFGFATINEIFYSKVHIIKYQFARISHP